MLETEGLKNFSVCLSILLYFKGDLDILCFMLKHFENQKIKTKRNRIPVIFIEVKWRKIDYQLFAHVYIMLETYSDKEKKNEKKPVDD